MLDRVPHSPRGLSTDQTCLAFTHLAPVNLRAWLRELVAMVGRLAQLRCMGAHDPRRAISQRAGGFGGAPITMHLETLKSRRH